MTSEEACMFASNDRVLVSSSSFTTVHTTCTRDSCLRYIANIKLIVI